MDSVVERALSRYGLRDPTPDEVLMEACPGYHEDESDTRRYHELFDAVMAMVGPKTAHENRNKHLTCAWCGAPRSPRSSFYCSQRCSNDARAVRRYCVVCGDLIGRPKTQTRRHYSYRMYCSSACRRKKTALSHESREDIVRLRAEGVAVREIADRLGCHRSTVYAVLKEAA